MCMKYYLSSQLSPANPCNLLVIGIWPWQHEQPLGDRLITIINYNQLPKAKKIQCNHRTTTDFFFFFLNY